jgi:hemerythrin-like domain-containing protein
MSSQTAVPPFPVTPRRPGAPEADLTGFRMIHRALRSGTRDLAEALTAVAGGSACPPARRRAVVAFATEVLGEIASHHSREDDVLWPVIAVSAGPAVDLEPLTDDHAALHAVLVRAEDALAGFARADADPRTAAAPLGRVLTEMADLLDEHIVEEEAEVFPVIRQYVSAGDFGRCERMFQQGTPPGQMLFLLPWIADQCTPAELDEVLRTAGAPLRVLLRLGQGRYTRRRDLVRGVA